MVQTEKHGKNMSLPSGAISYSERAWILNEIGKIAQGLYDEYIIEGGNSLGYNLGLLQGSLAFEIDVVNFQNHYYLAGETDHFTDIAYYFEYGTGLHNTKRAGKYRAGYIKPVIADYMTFFSKKKQQWVKTDRVAGVRPTLAMTKALKWIDLNETIIKRQLRLEYHD